MNETDSEIKKGIIAWFASNHVAANLLMVLIMLSGIYSAATIKKELHPAFQSNIVTIKMYYPGAAPSEVERGIVLKIEEAIKDIDEINRIESHSADSNATVRIEVHDGFDLAEVMDEIKIAVDGISSFPIEAESPTIKKYDKTTQAIQLQIYGEVNEFTAKALAEEIKQELLADTDIAKVAIWGAREYEITIEVDENALRKYSLTLSRVAQVIRNASIDMPGGSIRTENGDIMLRTQGQAYRQKEFEKLVLVSFADGTRLTLGDIATIDDGFEEHEGFALFDSAYSVGMAISAVGDQDTLSIAETVKEYIEDKRKELPQGVYLADWADSTFYLQSRLSMMLKNLLLGAILVFITLSLFMELKIAFWVMMGLPVCFLGAFALLPLEPFDVSLNMISLFGFILVLGIVVDDAIIIGESVHSQINRHGHSLQHVIEGTHRVAVPATFGVLTTICAFMPTIFISGVWHNFPAACGFVVLFCLLFSLIESKWILPAHLASMHTGIFRWIKSDAQNTLQKACNRHLYHFISHTYAPFLKKAIANRYTTLACFIASLILIIGLIGGGWARYVMVPDAPNDFVQVNLEMARGTAEHQTMAAIQHISESIYRMEKRHKKETGDERGFIKHVFSYGQQGLIGFFMLEMTKQEEREITSYDIVNRWREEVGEIPGAKVLSFSAAEPDSGPDIAFNLLAEDKTELEAAANELAQKLQSYAGVYDVKNGASETIDEIHLQIKPGAQALGITLADLGRQVREAFYGAEAQRIQRGNDEIKVMVRYPLSDRRSISNLESMYIRTAQGNEVPILAVADMQITPGYAKMTRINGKRALQVSAMVDKAHVEPRQIVTEITEEYFQQLFKQYPNVSFKLDGSSLEDQKMETSLFTGFALSLFGIFALLAVPLRSYLQPIVIMSVIPFGIIGAVVGHMLMGLAVSMMSIFGIIALSGVVVNDSLIMVDFINRAKEKGESIMEAVVGAGCQRFRAIMLTSLTTFFGVLPMLLESSVQAQFVIPMAVSLGFGIIFATVITLLLVPCLYVMLNDLARLTGSRVAQAEVDSAI